jgi:hypothetical protein
LRFAGTVSVNQFILQKINIMKALWFFYIGVAIDCIALLIAFYFMIGDMLKRSSGTNNPLMLFLTLALAALIVVAFLLKNAGKLTAANVLLWIPGLPLAGYGLIVLLFVVLKPDMR